MKKVNKTKALLGTLLLVCMAFTSCGLFDKDDDDPVVPVLTPSEVTVAEGATETVNISAGESPFQLSGGNEGIASATLNGNSISVTGLSRGSTAVTVTGSDGGTAELLITVTEVAIPLLTPSTVTVRVGAETTVGVGNGLIPYQLSGGDASIASVALNGSSITVRGLKAGNTAVTVSNKNGGTATLTIHVEASLIVEEQDRYNEFVTPALEKVLKEKLGMTIHRGITPPDITGYYAMESNCTKSTNPNDSYVGHLFNTYKMKFYDQNGIDISLEGFEVDYGSNKDEFIAKHTAPGTFICGEGNSFTVFFNETVQLTTPPNTIHLSVYSGTLDKNAAGKVIGIKNFQSAFIMRENNGRTDMIGNGEGRLFEDSYVDVITKAAYETIIYRTGLKSASAGNEFRSVLSK